MDEALQEIIEEAKAEFVASPRGGERRGANINFYIDPLPVIQDGSTRAPEDLESINQSRGNAIYFITGQGRPSVFADRKARTPSLTLIAGQYGVGKTELLHQMCATPVRANGGDPFGIGALPVSLPRCRGFVKFIVSSAATETEELNSHVLAHALFETIGGRDWSWEFIDRRLIPAIRRGDILLVLDGLDEAVTSRRELGVFFRALGWFMRDADQKANRARVVVTVRAEMLHTLVGSEEIGKFLNPQNISSAIHLHVLWIDFFGKSDILEYLRAHLADGAGVFKLLSNWEPLLHLLSRPLLLRIFCDLIGAANDAHAEGGAAIAKVINHLSVAPQVTKLLEIFVDRAAADEALIQGQEAISRFRWGQKELAECAVRLYRERRAFLGADDVRSILVPIHAESSIGGAAVLTDDEALQGIHKCPFLHRREGADRVHFSHRIFLEYFTALGMAARVRTSADGDELNEFDELVLNVDMRKFLKELLAEKWYPRTALSYGFNQPREWGIPLTPETYAHLDDQRKGLLDIMTVLPRTVVELKAAEDCIRQYLGEPALERFHPRYLMYNFEAVAVYLGYFRLRKAGQEIDQWLRTVLERLADRAIRSLCSDPILPNRQSWELFIERCLDIALRLRYAWLEDLQPKLIDRGLIFDSNIRQRINAIVTESRA